MTTAKWKVLKSTILIDRRPWLYLSEQDVILPNGARIDGYITWEEREYALIVALTNNGIPMARQYKHGLKSLSLDLPGGYLEINEEPILCAKRELLEETGITASKWFHLASLVLDNNRGNARTHFFLASDTHAESIPSLDETEELSIDYFTWEQLTSMVDQGQITSLPTVAALHIAQHHINKIS